jgi:hypothetical protein
MIEILNETATSALSDVDVILVLVDATAAVGPGDRTVLDCALREVQRSDDPRPDRECAPDRIRLLQRGICDVALTFT